MSAFLALWNDYPVERAEEYERWHTFEHVPERLTVPGMRAARRYVSADRRESFFTLYMLESCAVLDHSAYLDLVRNPTDWSTRMRPHFSAVLRIGAETTEAAGHGIGGAVIAHAYAIGQDRVTAARAALGAELRQAWTEARITGFRIGIAPPNQHYEVFTQQKTDPDTVTLVVLAEGPSSVSLRPLHTSLNTVSDQLIGASTPLRRGVFDLLISYRADEFPANRACIRPPQAHAGDGRDPTSHLS